MQGSALKKLKKEHNLTFFSLNFELDTEAEELFAEGFFSWIDLEYARKITMECSDLKEDTLIFLSYLMKISRMGHLALKVDKSNFVPRLDNIISNRLNLNKLEICLREGALNIPSQILNDFDLDYAYVGYPEKPFCKQGDLYYLQKNWVFETRLVHHFQRIAACPPEVKFFEECYDGQLNELQKSAIQQVFNHSCVLISGGPGTGKTYTAAKIVNAMINTFKSCSKETFQVVLTAPTGKAAAHLEAGVHRHLKNPPNIKSGTLHALLGIRSADDLLNEGGHLLADLVIVDECSMIDIRLFAYLLASLKEGSRLILMGDPDQLPSIDSGSVFNDLLDFCNGNASVPSVRLEKCMRSDRPDINELASAIRKGDALEQVKAYWNRVKVDLGFHQNNSQEIYNKICNYLEPLFLKPIDGAFNPEEILEKSEKFRVISCLRQGPLGVDALNRLIADHYQKMARRGQTLCIPIMICRNDYEADLYNGDTGVLVKTFYGPEQNSHSEQHGYAFFWNKQRKLRKLPAAFLPDYEYAYCMSVHKSQGSEYDQVLFLVPKGSDVFGKEVLYTAITRARSHLSVDGDWDTIAQALSSTCKKESGIAKRLASLYTRTQACKK